ncbi:hypothetical protein RWA02_32140 (plasmid) [Sinorhizobium meliloti]|uniref:hypothetical protein n=1 Tax=Rhizobium meliloti TaxID=382 RepID=UPI000FDB7E6D|nr:hypothetical protein [Sinorhizobium meliloti]MDW9626873.1 hypothetical protein [Sinorhizobium meliloti]MDW9997575.1 hypothetical protein [Sinorhizobium meliloti]RVK64930.1 hypothetical protein CN157_32970 [Sinorhizobium meliloti]RVP38570.1 hypothetical protein CN075_29860 [Sinorhizobium meliloti]RVQ68421.1 hypothetical protein CN061_29430 [Sinorhizobium meliloti]
MAEQITLKPGEYELYSTRPAGLGTTLFAQCSDKGDSVLGWHFELCCKRLNKQPLEAGQPWQTSISEGRGALVTVSNQGFNDIKVWTDY